MHVRLVTLAAAVTDVRITWVLIAAAVAVGSARTSLVLVAHALTICRTALARRAAEVRVTTCFQIVVKHPDTVHFDVAQRVRAWDKVAIAHPGIRAHVMLRATRVCDCVPVWPMLRAITTHNV